MFKPLIFSLALVAAVSACSKKDDAISNNSGTKPATTVDSSRDAAGNGANVTAQAPASSEPKSDATAPEAAILTEAPPKRHKKQPHAAHDGAKGVHSATARRWSEFQAMVDRCDTETGSGREQCLNEARDVYRTANFKCDALPTEERQRCLQFADRWNSAVADAPKAAVKHDKDPTTIPTSPGDPRPAERNRDSTKQQQDAVGTVPDPTKPN